MQLEIYIQATYVEGSPPLDNAQRCETKCRLTGAYEELRFGRDVGGLLVALHAAAEDAVDAVGLGEDGGVAHREAGAEAEAEHCGGERGQMTVHAAISSWRDRV